MTRLALIILAFLAVAIVAARCDPPARAQPAMASLANHPRFSESSPAQPITPTATLTATLTTTPTATIALPSATHFPTPTPAPTDAPVCTVTQIWSVAPGMVAHVMQRPTDQPAAKWEWVLTIEPDWPLPEIPFYSDRAYLIDVPGPTATIWPTPEPDTETPTPAPTQTPWIVTASPEATITAPPTASATATRVLLLPVTVRGFRRWEWWLQR